MSYLSPYQVSPIQGNDRSDSVAAKLATLVALVKEILAEHGDTSGADGWRVIPDVDWRWYGDSAAQRDVRLAVMGNPARYCTVRWAGVSGVSYDPNAVPHVFEVYVARGTGDGEKPGPTEAQYAADEAAFRSLLESEGVHDGTEWTSPPGLLYALRRQHAVTVGGTASGGDELALGAPVITRPPDRVRPDPSNPDDRHEILFTVTLS